MALPVCIAIAGLAIDGGVLLSSRRALQSVADGAARAGATRLDLARLRGSGGADVKLEPALAQQAARAYLRDALGHGGVDWGTAVPEPRVEVGVRRVHVVIQARPRTAFLRVIHIDSVPVEADAYADVEYGIHDGGGG